MQKNSIKKLTNEIRTLSKICSYKIVPGFLTEDTFNYFGFCLSHLPELTKQLSLIINNVIKEHKNQQIAFLSCLLHKYKGSCLIANKLNIESLKIAILTYHWIDFATCDILIRNIFTLRSCADNLKDKLTIGRLNINNIGVRKLNTNIAQLHRLLIKIYPTPQITNNICNKKILRVKRPLIQDLATTFKKSDKDRDEGESKTKKAKTQQESLEL